MSETVIKFEHVSKEYRLGAIGGGTLKGDLQSLMARLRGKEDPNTVVGTKAVSGNQRFMALNDISFEVKKGEALGIIGHNGAGKSTLLKLLSRVTAPTSGTIGYNGRIASMLEVGTGFHPELTGRENVYMNGAILGMTRAEIDRKFDDIVRFAEMEQFIDTPVKRYSSGMYVKLAFSVAAHLDSEIMVMDEVLAVGDMAFQQKCLDKMSSAANQEGRTVLYVSHNMNTIRQLCSRCIVLDRGRIVFSGDVEDAVAIYMKTADQDEIAPCIDLEKKQRPASSANKVLMKELSLIGRDACIVERGEQMHIQLRWRAKADLKNVRFRMIVRYKDDSPVGLVQSGTIGDVNVAQEMTTDFLFDTKMLAEGAYYFSIAMYQSDYLGNSVILDHVTRAFSVEIVSTLEEDNLLNWEHRWWGSVQFPDLKIVTRGEKDGKNRT